MKVENILNADDNNDAGVRIELSKEEAESIYHSLSRTMCKDKNLTISMELEGKLWLFLKYYR